MFPCSMSVLYVSIHASRTGGDGLGLAGTTPIFIVSIHASRTGGDANA